MALNEAQIKALSSLVRDECEIGLPITRIRQDLATAKSLVEVVDGDPNFVDRCLKMGRRSSHGQQIHSTIVA